MRMTETGSVVHCIVFGGLELGLRRTVKNIQDC